MKLKQRTGIPYKYKKYGYFTLALASLVFISILIFKHILKEDLPIESKETVIESLQLILGIGVLIVMFSQEKNEDERILEYKYQSMSSAFSMIITMFIMGKIMFLIGWNSSLTDSQVYPIYMGVFFYFIFFYLRKKSEE